MKDFISDWNIESDPNFNSRNCIGFDLDDTLTENGELPSKVIEGLEKLKKEGHWKIFLITGRPAGWADVFIRLFPFDAVIAENGAVIRYWKNGRLNKEDKERPLCMYWHPSGYSHEAPPEINVEKDKAKEVILKEFPRAQVASDQDFRLYDLAIDFAEEINPPLPFPVAEEIKKKFESFGATAKVSSIHVNGWWGSFSKGSALTFLSQHIYDFSLEKNLIFVGDSPNDSSLFEETACSIGVANLLDFDGKVEFTKPQFITKKERSQGALEIISKLCQKD